MKKLFSIVALALVAIMVLSACEEGGEAQKKEQAITESYQAKFSAARPYPSSQMTDSLERKNLIERLLRFNDPNKIGYVYLLSDYGTVISFYTIRGKISSVNSQLTTPNIINYRGTESGIVTDAPGDDGSYGPNEGGDAGVFFFTTEGVLVEWSGKFLYADTPLKVSSAPVLIYDRSTAEPSSISTDK